MTDRYADLRDLLDLTQTNVFNRDDVRALLADYDRMRDALWIVTEHNALHFGESHNTVIVGRAALAQEQGESDDN